MKFFVLLARGCVSLVIRSIPGIQELLDGEPHRFYLASVLLLSVLHLKFLNKIYLPFRQQSQCRFFLIFYVF